MKPSYSTSVAASEMVIFQLSTLFMAIICIVAATVRTFGMELNIKNHLPLVVGLCMGCKLLGDMGLPHASLHVLMYCIMGQKFYWTCAELSVHSTFMSQL